MKRQLEGQVLTVTVLVCICSLCHGDYTNPNDPLDDRVNDLVSRMTLSEKIQQTQVRTAPAISRLGIRSYHYWNEALRGIERHVVTPATCFPPVFGMAHSWNPDLLLEVGSAISEEVRAYSNEVDKELAYFSPVNVNLCRDPRWGRTEEAFSEDPFLNGKLGAAYCRGFQGNDEYTMASGDATYLKAICTTKHYVANNTEFNRHSSSSDMDERTLREFYLPAFKRCVQEGGTAALMSAYNAVNGVPCSANRFLLTDILRNEWGFQGYVVSDCDAIYDVYANHHYASNSTEAVGWSLWAGCDIECPGPDYIASMQSAINAGYISEADVTQAVKRIFRMRFRTGEFDPSHLVAYRSIPTSKRNAPEHQQLARQVQRQGMTLLKNEGNVLPLDVSQLNSIVVVGPLANRPSSAGDYDAYGGYTAVPPYAVNIQQGIESRVSGQATFMYAAGMNSPTDGGFGFSSGEEQSIQNADVVVAVVGSDARTVGEGSDRSSIDLPGAQESMLQWLYQRNQNLVVVLQVGFPVAVVWPDDNVPAILASWHPGMEAGNAAADVIFGDDSPAGRLTMTWYQNTSDLPDFTDYNIIYNGRTYQYFTGSALYPFGHGLSYTQFTYSNLHISPGSMTVDGQVQVSVDVQNTGDLRGDEVVQLYIHDQEADVPVAIKALKGFKRIALDPGQIQTVNMTVSASELAYFDNNTSQWVVELGTFDVMVGASSQDIRLTGTLEVSPPIPAPSNVVLVPGNGHVHVSWQDNSSGDWQEQGFEIQRKLYNGNYNWHTAGTVGPDVTEFLDTDSIYGLIQYTYRVGAFEN